MTFGTADLMASPDFDRRELGRVREAIFHAQMMGRIGNLISTWERELDDADFTSGLFAHALLCGDVSLQNLQGAVLGEAAESAHVATALSTGRSQKFFLRRWRMRRRRIEALAEQIQTVDVRQLLSGLDELLVMELESRGRK